MVKMGIQRIQPRIIAEVQHDKMRPSLETIFQFVDDDDLVFEFSVPFLILPCFEVLFLLLPGT